MNKGQIIQFQQGEYDEKHVFAARRILIDFDIKQQLSNYMQSSHYTQMRAANAGMWFDGGREGFVDFLTINGFVERLNLNEIATVHLGAYDELYIRIICNDE